MANNEAADMAVYRDSHTNVAYVSPGTFIVSKSNKKQIRFRNYTGEGVDITLTKGSLSSKLHLAPKTDPGNGWKGPLAIDVFDPDVYEFTEGGNRFCGRPLGADAHH